MDTLKRLVYLLVVTVSLVLVRPMLVEAYVYEYTIEGQYYTGFPSPTLNFYGTAIIEDSYDEQIHPIYDEWYINSWEFTIEGVHYEGVDGLIVRSEATNYMLMSEIMPYWGWGEAEHLAIAVTGAFFMPPEMFIFQANPFELVLPDNTSTFIHDIKFYDQVLLDVPEPGSVLLMGLGILFLLFVRKKVSSMQ